MPLDALIARSRSSGLAGIWRRGYVKRYRALVMRRAARVEGRCTSRAPSRRRSIKLLAVKDEYEVARLHTDPAFRAALEAQFEGAAGKDFAVKFNLAPPVLSKAKNGGQPTQDDVRPMAVAGARHDGEVPRPARRRCSIRSARRWSARWSASSPTITKSRCHARSSVFNADNAKDVERSPCCIRTRARLWAREAGESGDGEASRARSGCETAHRSSDGRGGACIAR